MINLKISNRDIVYHRIVLTCTVCKKCQQTTLLKKGIIVGSMMALSCDICSTKVPHRIHELISLGRRRLRYHRDGY